MWITLETSYIERDSNYSLWGLLVNSGYLTALRRVDENTVVVKIPNDEVMSEFQLLLQSLSPKNINVIVEFKQGENMKQLKEQALQQILDNQYYKGLTGEVLCVGIAHDKKHCEMVYKVINR